MKVTITLGYCQDGPHAGEWWVRTHLEHFGVIEHAFVADGPAYFEEVRHRFLNVSLDTGDQL